ncbi:MAG: GerMN domain-containing protein [Desulfobacterales bacterium]
MRGEERSALRPGSDDPAFCRRLIEALSAGPQSGLARTLPKDTTIRAVFVEGKTAYVDFSREISISHPGGILSELMTIYSVVNTLVLNVDAVDTVKLLIAGQDAETLASHVDIRFPLNADILLIK